MPFPELRNPGMSFIMVISTLFLFMNHMVKVIVYHLMFCKSGILIFIFAENNYLVRWYTCPHHVD